MDLVDTAYKVVLTLSSWVPHLYWMVALARELQAARPLPGSRLSTAARGVDRILSNC
jgi:hypothetical protein